MSTKSDRPATYDEITRRTVPELDSSMRPTKEQEAQARDGFRALDDAEKILLARVSDALLTAGVAMGKISVEVDRQRVTLVGSVPDIATIDRATQLASAVPGVGVVDNQLVVPATP